MKAHFSSHTKSSYDRAWAPAMSLIANELHERGYVVSKDPDLMWRNEPDFVTMDSYEEDDLIIYTDCDSKLTPYKGLYVSLQGPEPGYFSIDRVGKWPYLEQTYDAMPAPILNTDSDFYFNEFITLLKENKTNKYHNKSLSLGKDSPEPKDLPDNHILILVSSFDDKWRDGWQRLGVVLNTLLNELSDPIVVKFDPAFLLTPSGNVDEDRLEGASKIMESMEGNVIHYTGLESLHDILKKTKICIMDEAVNDLEPFMYPVPIITHGAPPYRKYVKQVYHEHELVPAIKDISWFDHGIQYAWLKWFVMHYLCCDKKSVFTRLNDLHLRDDRL